MGLLPLLTACAPLPPAAGASAPAHADVRTVDGTYTDPSGRSGAYRMLVPDDVLTGEPYGVLFFFPWDGGRAAYAKEARLHAPLAAAHHLIVVSMRQPGRDQCWWAPTVEENVRYVDAFLRERLLGPLHVDPTRVFLTGLSGGADFAAAFHYQTGYTYGGGAVALCGGDLPRSDGGDCDTEADPPVAPALPARADRPDVRYDFALVPDDPLLPASRAAAAFYTAAGFAHVRHRLVPGSGHCGFSEGWEALGALAEGLDYVDPRPHQ